MATTTQTLADVFRARLAAGGAGYNLETAIADAIGIMCPYIGETGDLRPSEETWILERRGEAASAAKEAAIQSVAAYFERELPRLLPSSEDDTVPPHLWEQGGDAINGDAELAATS